MAGSQVCPKCGSSKVVRIVYGLPMEGGIKEEAEGKIKLGGDVIEVGLSPAWYCRACTNQWGLYETED
jgi:hypothetical protein